MILVQFFKICYHKFVRSSKYGKNNVSIGKFKDGEGHFEKFMGFMQSEEAWLKEKVAHVEKTIPGILPDKSGVMFKVHVHDEQAMKDFVSKNPVMKPIYEECIQSIDLFD